MICAIVCAMTGMCCPLFGDGLDLTPLLSLIPPPWNMVAIFGLGVLAKWLHSRWKPPAPPAPVDPNNPSPIPAPVPTPAPSPGPAPTGRPILDMLQKLLASLIAQKAAQASQGKVQALSPNELPIAEEIDPEVEHYKKLVKDLL